MNTKTKLVSAKFINFLVGATLILFVIRIMLIQVGFYKYQGQLKDIYIGISEFESGLLSMYSESEAAFEGRSDQKDFSLINSLLVDLNNIKLEYIKITGKTEPLFDDINKNLDGVAEDLENSIRNNDSILLRETQNKLIEINIKVDLIEDKIIVEDRFVDKKVENRKKMNTICIIGVFAVFILVNLIYHFYTGKQLKHFNKIKFFSGLMKLVAKGDLSERYPITSVVCSEVMKCGNEACSIYNSDGKFQCYFKAGSYGPEFGNKIECQALLNGTYKKCNSCPVFKDQIKDEVDFIGAWFNNFIDIFSESVKKGRDISVKTKRISDNLNTICEDVSSDAMGISKKIDIVKNNTEKLNSEVQNSNAYIEGVRVFIKDVNAEIKEQSDIINNSTNSIEEMLGAVRSISGITNEKKNLSDRLSGLAEDGINSMRQTKKDINNISESARSIMELITLIGNVTERTNLLAMNAAIEAAHAGESGRGFAVVAGEIRKLSEQTRNNSKNINASLVQIIEQINNTAGSTDKTSVLIENILGGIVELAGGMREINSQMSDVAMGSEKISSVLSKIVNSTEVVLSSAINLSTGIEGINSSIETVDELTKINSKNYDDISREMDEISSQSILLTKMASDNSQNIDNLAKNLSIYKIIDEKKNGV